MKISEWKSDWLRFADWDFVESVNENLCNAKSALHKPTSDGYATTREKWEESHQKYLTLSMVVELCRECHRGAPFCFYNGNTFVAIIRQAIVPVLKKLDAEGAFLFRSTIGHCVAGTIGLEDLENVLKDLPEIDLPTK